MTTKTTDSATRAVAYYRSATAEGDDAIERQREQVRRWAEKHGIKIVREFEDRGVSAAVGRPGFAELMTEWVKKDRDFRYILCLDVSRWGRFQGIDLSAQYSAECRKAGKQVVFTTVGKPQEGDPLFPLFIQYGRFLVDQFRCELGAKVRRGRMFAAQQGYWTGGTPPYGLRRLLVDHKGNPLHLLEPGQRKGIQNQHVTLVAGVRTEVTAIRRIFHEFVDLGYSTPRIAAGLNANRIPSPGGDGWTARHVLTCLRTRAYAGRTIFRPKRTQGAPDEWVRTSQGGEGIVSRKQFERAQEILAATQSLSLRPRN
jgi:DNA invertase Pin-like site-specific DNA recombinase